MKKIPTITLALLTAGTAGATTYIYNETTSTTTQWAAGTSWDATPVSASDTILSFTGDLLEGTNIVSNNDIGGNFLLNRLEFAYNGTLVTPSPTVTISGNPLEFTGTSPQIFYNPGTVGGTTTTFRPQLIIDSNMVLSSDLTVYTNNTGASPAVVLNGVISGSSSLTFSSRAGQATSWLLSNTGNSYAGDTQLSLSTTSGRDNILRLGASEVIPNGVGKGNLFFNILNERGSLIVELSGFNETINGLNSAVPTNASGDVIVQQVRNTSATGATLTIGDNNTSGSFIGGLLADGTGGGALSLTKIGSGTQVLAGKSTYTGNTTINGGTLKIDYNIFGVGSGPPGGTTSPDAPVNFFSTQSAVSLGADTTFAIEGRGDGATTNTVGVAIGNSSRKFTLDNSVADQLVVGQVLTFTKDSGTGTPVADAFIVSMDRGATTTTIYGNRRMSSGGASVATIATTATIGATSQTLASLTLTGAAATNATIDFGSNDNLTLLINSAPVQLNDGSTITLANWNGSFSGGGGDQWLFTGSPTDFTSIFSQSEVIFDGYGFGYNIIDFSGTYEVVGVAVPEPSAYALVVALGALGLAIRRRRRQS